MAVSIIGSPTVENTNGSHSQKTFSHTVPSGNERLLLVFVHGTDNKRVETATYNGKRLHRAAFIDSGISIDARIEIWFQTDPDVGAHDVHIDWDNSVSDSGIVALNLTGADATHPVGAIATKQGSGSSVTTSVATISDGSLVLGAATFRDGNTAPFSPGTGVTELWDTQTGGQLLNDIGFTGGKMDAATPGSYTFKTTASKSASHALAVIEVRPPLPSTVNLDTNLTTDLTSSNRTSATVSHTVPAGTDRLLLVSILSRGDKQNLTVTFDGASLTEAIDVHSGSTTSMGAQMFYLVNPPVKTADVVVTWPGFSASPSGVVIANLTGVDQTDPVPATAGEATSSLDEEIDKTITTLVDDSLIVMIAGWRDSSADPILGSYGARFIGKDQVSQLAVAMHTARRDGAGTYQIYAESGIPVSRALAGVELRFSGAGPGPAVGDNAPLFGTTA